LSNIKENVFYNKLTDLLQFIYKLLFKITIYCSLFMTMELFGRFFKNSQYNGFVEVPIWMVIVYMNIAWLDDILMKNFKKLKTPKWLQALIITIFIYIFELIFGLFFKYLLDINVWDYSKANFMGYKVNLFGVISLYGILPWYGVSWFLIWFYPRINRMIAFKQNKNMAKINF